MIRFDRRPTVRRGRRIPWLEELETRNAPAVSGASVNALLNLGSMTAPALPALSQSLATQPVTTAASTAAANTAAATRAAVSGSQDPVLTPSFGSSTAALNSRLSTTPTTPATLTPGQPGAAAVLNSQLPGGVTGSLAPVAFTLPASFTSPQLGLVPALANSDASQPVVLDAQNNLPPVLQGASITPQEGPLTLADLEILVANFIGGGHSEVPPDGNPAAAGDDLDALLDQPTVTPARPAEAHEAVAPEEAVPVPPRHFDEGVLLRPPVRLPAALDETPPLIAERTDPAVLGGAAELRLDLPPELATAAALAVYWSNSRKRRDDEDDNRRRFGLRV